MQYETLKTSSLAGQLLVTLNRPEQQNSINYQMLLDLGAVLDAAEADESLRMVVLLGQPGVFCTGMDFEEVAAAETAAPASVPPPVSRLYMDTLTRLATMPRVTVAAVDGRTMAGGVGLVAACDLVVATEKTQFSLSEALWGLLPACVTPYLIRRVGVQKAFRMTLTTLPINAQKALEFGLVDEISEQPEQAIRRLWTRLFRLQNSTVADLKAYFRKMWIINEEMERVAVAEISRLMELPKVKKNISDFVTYQRFPWDQG